MVALLVSFGALAGEVELWAPWLLVYDSAGRPRWEIQVEHLVRGGEGWQGEGVEVYLFHEGEAKVRLLAGAIQADHQGRTWTLSGGVNGWVQNLRFSCERASWEEGLVLWSLSAEAEGLVVHAAQAHLHPGEPVELSQARAELGDWQADFEAGSYDPETDLLATLEVRLRGHDLEGQGEALLAWPGEGRLVIRGAQLAAHP